MTTPTAREDVVVYRDPAAYTSHPCIARLASGEYLVAFNETLPRRPHQHPPRDPRYVNLIARSRDGGSTWEAPRVAPGYEMTGVECPSLSVLTNGDVLICQSQFRWAPLETARKLSAAGEARFEVFDPDFPRHWRLPHGDEDWDRSPVPYARGDLGTFISISTDNGATWDSTRRLVTAPYVRGYTPRPVAELPGGTVVLALGTAENDDTAIYVMRSPDGGHTWHGPVTAIPRRPGRRYGEPSPLALPDGRLLMMVREDHTQHLHQTESVDSGETWSPPRETEIWGLPPHLLRLRDGRVLCVYGHRRPPFGLRARLSVDAGSTWESELTIRDDLRNANCGYPTAIEEDSGTVYVVYYAEDGVGVTHVLGTRFRLFP